ncbi:hypothetical protein [Streptomyces sp. 2A115]
MFTSTTDRTEQARTRDPYLDPYLLGPITYPLYGPVIRAASR